MKLFNSSRPVWLPTNEIGLFRGALGMYLLYYQLTLMPELFQLFGPDSMIRPDYLHWPHVSLLFFVWHPAAILILWVLLIVLLIRFTLGAYDYLGLALLFLVQLTFHQANPFIIHEPQPLANLFLLCFFLFPLNVLPALISFDQQAACEKTLGEAKKIVKTLVLFFGVYYLIVGLKKLPDPLWRSGEALSYLLQWEPLARDNGLTRFLLEKPLLIKGLTWATLVFELTFVFLVLTRWRPWIIIAGLLLHTGIFLTLDLGTITPVFWVWYFLLLDETTLKRFNLVRV